jgi:hypothetical protein
MYENLQNGNSFNPNHDAKDLETALGRQEAIHAFNIPLLGPKMFWQFDELGYDFSINYCNDELIDPSCRTSNKPVRWDYFFEPARQRLYKVFAAINKLKTDYPAFGSSNFNYDVGGTGKRLIIQHESMDVVIIGNFDVVPIDIIPGFTQTGVWYDYFGGNAIVETSLNNAFELQPGEYRIYTTEQLPTPDLSINTVNVTFRVDMSQESINAATDTISLSGSFNDFEKLIMNFVGSGIYQTTITLVEGEPIEYKFRINSSFENPVGLCAAGNFGNRVYAASTSDEVLDVVCYSSCTACPDPNNVNDLTFRVDASELASIDPDGLHIAGTFNGFTPEPMIADGNGVYSFTISEVQGASLLWKYLNGDSFTGEEDVPAACGLPDGFGGNNRVLLMPGEDTVLDAVCFSSCEVCEGSLTCENPFPAVNPASLSTSFNPNSVSFSWDPVPLQIGCQVQARVQGSASLLGAQIVAGPNADGLNAPLSLFSPGDYQWRVRCGCSQTPLIAGAFSAWQPFTIGSGISLDASPNPTSGHADVAFEVMNGGNATLEVYDLNGRVIETLFSQEAQSDLEYRIHFDGSALPNGIYLYRLTTNENVEMEKFVIGR